MSLDPIINALSAFAAWVFGLVGSVFTAAWDFVSDAFVALGDAFFQALAGVIVAIPAPSFLSSMSLQGVFSQMSGDVLYFLGVFQIGPGLALLGSAFGFRLLRKLFTLFQW